MTEIEPLPVNDVGSLDFSQGDDIIDEIAHDIEGGKSLLNTKDLREEEGDFCRVATIHDGNSFLHCILKMMNREYNSSTYEKRRNMANELRDELYSFAKREKLSNLALLKSTEEADENTYSFLSDILHINMNIYVIDEEKDKLQLVNFFPCQKEKEKRSTFCFLRDVNNIYEPIGKINKIKNEIYFNFKSKA
jgi:hypothetical protein